MIYDVILKTKQNRALEIAKKVYGPEHADVATYLNNLARVLKAQVGVGATGRGLDM